MKIKQIFFDSILFLRKNIFPLFLLSFINCLCCGMIYLLLDSSIWHIVLCLLIACIIIFIEYITMLYCMNQINIIKLESKAEFYTIIKNTIAYTFTKIKMNFFVFLIYRCVLFLIALLSIASLPIAFFIAQFICIFIFAKIVFAMPIIVCNPTTSNPVSMAMEYAEHRLPKLFVITLPYWVVNSWNLIVTNEWLYSLIIRQNYYIGICLLLIFVIYPFACCCIIKAYQFVIQ